MRDASATLIDVPVENAINMHSVWTAWFQFWRKQHLRSHVLFSRNILNEQILKCNDTYIVIISCVPLIKLPDAPKIRTQRFCIRMWICILNSTNIRNSIFFLTALLQRSTCTDAQTGSTEAQTGSEEGLGCTYPDRSLLSGSSHDSSFTLSVTGLCAVGMHSLASSFVSFSSSSVWLSSSSFKLLMSALSSHGAVDSAFSSWDEITCHSQPYVLEINIFWP